MSESIADPDLEIKLMARAERMRATVERLVPCGYRDMRIRFILGGFQMIWQNDDWTLTRNLDAWITQREAGEAERLLEILRVG